MEQESLPFGGINGPFTMLYDVILLRAMWKFRTGNDAYRIKEFANPMCAVVKSVLSSFVIRIRNLRTGITFYVGCLSNVIVYFVYGFHICMCVFTS